MIIFHETHDPDRLGQRFAFLIRTVRGRQRLEDIFLSLTTDTHPGRGDVRRRLLELGSVRTGV